MAISGMDTSVKTPEHISTFFNEIVEQTAKAMLVEGKVGFTVMMLDPIGERTVVRMDWPADPAARNHSAQVLKAVAIATDAVATCIVSESWTLAAEYLEADGGIARGYACYADHPNREEKVTCCLTYREGERLFSAISLRGIERDSEDQVIALGAAPEDMLRVTPNDGKGGRLDTLLSPRTPNVKERKLAAKLLTLYPDLFDRGRMDNVIAKMGETGDLQHAIEAEIAERLAGLEAMVDRGDQPIN